MAMRVSKSIVGVDVAEVELVTSDRGNAISCRTAKRHATRRYAVSGVISRTRQLLREPRSNRLTQTFSRFAVNLFTLAFIDSNHEHNDFVIDHLVNQPISTAA